MDEATESAAGVSGNLSNKLATRERYWEECDADAKTQRLRDEVVRLYRMVSELSSIVRSLQWHQHADGKIVVPLHNPNRFADEQPRPVKAWSLLTERERK